MMPAAPPPTPAPIHDIAGPVWLFPYPVWMVIVAALAFLALVGLLFWLTRRKHPARMLTPRERALKAIEDLRREAPDDSYGFGIKVSDALRTYIRDQHGLDALTRTSVEFLEVLRGDPAFTDNEKAALSEFLESVDLLKYARQSAAADDIRALLEIAERLVRGEGATQTTVTR
ncbi:MAG TPA: DUF4381 family protein [Terrimicrobiaceae bacterium]|jgi:hypothetical protein